jgi:uncharacterized membrane protein
MLLLAFSLFFGSGSSQGAIWNRVVDHVAHGALSRAMDKVSLHFGPTVISTDDSDDDSSDDSDEAEPSKPAVPVPPHAPAPPRKSAFQVSSDGKSFQFTVDSDDEESPKINLSGKGLVTVDALHRIAEAGGWSMTLVGSPKEKIDLDLKNVEPREALRALLQQSGGLGVLKGEKLVVVASPDGSTKGQLIESGSHRSSRSKRGKKHSQDVLRVMHDITIDEGQVVQGDVVCFGCSVELQPGSVVQGGVVAFAGNVLLHQGALVVGDGVAMGGGVEVERGGQVMGEIISAGPHRIWTSDKKTSNHNAFTSLGPFGLFPTLALFAIMYLLGLLVLRMWPERVRNVGHAFAENPTRSFVVGFLCWLLLLPLMVLLLISVVGIPLIPLLPLAIFLGIVVGLSSLALKIGESLPAGPGQRFVPPAALGMGMTVLLLVAFVPWLGISLLALLQFFALGASVGSRFGRALPPHV